MFEFLKPKQKPVTYDTVPTGYIHVRPTSTDYKAWTSQSLGVDDQEVDWGEYLPLGEEQYVKFKWDTMACVSYSAINSVITQIHWMIRENKIPKETFDFLKQNGYIYTTSGEVNFSRRFVSMMANTTPNGNTFTNVAHAIRHNGLIPDQLLPFGGRDFYSYHDKTLLTQNMISLGKLFLEHFEVSYEWVFTNDDKDLESNEEQILRSSIKKSPLQIAVPYHAYHAMVLFGFKDKMNKNTFDSYKPFINRVDWGEEIAVGFRILISPKKTLPDTYIFTRTVRIGSRGIEVQRLQERLNIKPFDGIFGRLTDSGVKEFQRNNGLVADGIVGKKTRAVLNSGTSAIQKDTTVYPAGIVRLAKAIERQEGYYAPGEMSRYPNGTIAWKNKNPGNFRYVGQKNVVPSSDGKWCTFPTYEDGFNFLCAFLYKAATTGGDNYRPDMTLYEFFSVYAPKSENDTLKYVKNVAQWLGKTIDTKIKDLV